MRLFLPLQVHDLRYVLSVLHGMYRRSRLVENRRFIQHGSTTLHQHCRAVALVSLQLVRKFNLKVDEHSLIRGALLHDYYLYDWHKKDHPHPHLHGFFHPSIALKNASAIINLNKTEKDIIKHHMFPLTPCPPQTKEGWIVSISDKLCSIYETLKLNEERLKGWRKFARRLCNKIFHCTLPFPHHFPIPSLVVK